MSRVVNLIVHTVPLLEQSESAYEKIKNDNDLRRVFHRAGQELHLLIKSLKTLENHLVSASGSAVQATESAKQHIKACKEKATTANRVFEHVARAPEGSRFREYTKMIQLEKEADGDDVCSVEVLVHDMLQDVLELAKQCGVKEVMEDEMEDLEDAIEELKKMVRPAGNGNKGSMTFNNMGNKDQFNSVGGGPMYNNTSNGNMLPWATFQKGVNFGENAASAQDDADFQTENQRN
jgi:hypothetical protein